MKTRTIELISRLALSTTPVSLKELSIGLALSKRSVSNEIAEADLFLKMNGCQGIRTIKGKGYYLEIEANQLENLIDSALNDDNFYLTHKERSIILFMCMALGNSIVRLKDKEDLFKVSKSALDEDVKELRDQLLAYDVEVVYQGKNGMKLQGDEHQIRTTIVDFINKNVGFISFNGEGTTYHTNVLVILFERIIGRKILKLATSIYEQMMNETNDDVYRSQAIIFIAIWLKRNQMLEHLNAQFPLEIRQYKKTEQLRGELEKSGINVSNLEGAYILSMVDLICKKKKNLSDWLPLQVETIQLITFVENALGIKIENNRDNLFKNLFQHLEGLEQRLTSGIHMINPLTESIKNKYGLLFGTIKDFFSENLKERSCSISDDEFAYITIHFSIALENFEVNGQGYFRVAIVCHNGLATGNLLAIDLRKHFPMVRVVAVLSEQELRLTGAKGADIIFTTSYLTSVVDQPSCHISPLLKETEIEQVKKFLEANKKLKVKGEYRSTVKLFSDILKVINQYAISVDPKIVQGIQDSAHIIV